VELRKQLDLYANLRPVKSLPGIKSRYEDVDLVVVRENTEDLYSGLEHVVVPGVVESLKIITEKASTRIARFAFAYAQTKGRKRISAVHKANIMKLSDGLFLDCCRNVAKDYPAVQYDEIIVDNCCMQLVLDPTRFDMLLLENLYGDIVSDLCAAFIGGLGMAPGANIGEGVAIFEAVHGTAPDIAGKNVANPIALIFSGALMLDHLGEPEAADRVRAAVRGLLADGKKLTRDLGGSAATTELAEAIAAKVQSSS
jgi:isocitrate dehydrogenase (NAD+)